MPGPQAHSCQTRPVHTYTRPRPTSNTPTTFSFQPAEQFRQLHPGCIHLAAPTLCCQAGTTLLGPPILAAPGPASCPKVALWRGYFTAACFFQRPKPALNIVPHLMPLCHRGTELFPCGQARSLRKVVAPLPTWSSFCLVTPVLPAPDPDGPWHIRAEETEIR